MNNSQLIQALKRQDPTEAFVQYVQTVKPYHTKILDTLIEYVWEDEINVNVCELYQIDTQLYTEIFPISYDCGFGFIWDAPAHFSSILYNINGVILGGAGTASWFIAGNHASLFPPGTLIVVGKNVGGGNGLYTVLSSSNVGPQTQINVNEPILAATPHGSMFRFDSGIDSILSADISTNSIVVAGDQTLRYQDGSYVQITNSLNSGKYIVQIAVLDGSNTRIHLRDPLVVTTGAGGQVSFVRPGYDDPPYCRLATASNLHTDVYIAETITFDVSFELDDAISAFATENYVPGYGALPYGSVFGGVSSGESGTTPENEGILLPTGYDQQYFDMGGLDETVETVNILYNRSTPI